jgi:hypothetical protein
MSSVNISTRALRLLVCLVVALPCAAAGPPAQERSRAEPAPPAPRRAAAQTTNPPSVLPAGVITQGKISFSNTDTKGDCPAGATKIERCSGVYSNGNSWEIAPCCRTETN